MDLTITVVSKKTKHLIAKPMKFMNNVTVEEPQCPYAIYWNHIVAYDYVEYVTICFDSNRWHRHII